MNMKILNERHLKFLSLKGGCTGSSESTLVKMPLCWKSQAQLTLLIFAVFYLLQVIYIYIRTSLQKGSHKHGVCYLALIK